MGVGGIEFLDGDDDGSAASRGAGDRAPEAFRVAADAAGPQDGAARAPGGLPRPGGAASSIVDRLRLRLAGRRSVRVAALLVALAALGGWLASRPAGAPVPAAVPAATRPEVSTPFERLPVGSCSIRPEASPALAAVVHRYLPAAGPATGTTTRCRRTRAAAVVTERTLTVHRGPLRFDVAVAVRTAGGSAGRVGEALSFGNRTTLAGERLESAGLVVTVVAVGPRGHAVDRVRVGALAEALSQGPMP